MEPVNASQDPVLPGAEVGIVFYEEFTPCALSATIASVKPFAATTTEAGAGRLKNGQRVMLVLQSGSKYAKAEAEVVACADHNGSWRIEVGHFGWEEVDRRRFPRHAIQLDVSLRSVLETEDGVEIKQFSGTTEDVSLGGVWVRPEESIPPGSLLELSTTLDGQAVRILSIVARDAGENGIGIEFLDFVGGARYYLHGFLEQRAA